MQSVSNLSFINQAIVTSSTVTSTKSKNAADYLLVGIAHAQHADIPVGEGGLPVHVVVTITLQCVHDSPVFVNMEAPAAELDNTNAPAVSESKKATSVLPLLDKSSNNGLKWGGQTECVHAHGTIELK